MLGGDKNGASLSFLTELHAPGGGYVPAIPQMTTSLFQNKYQKMTKQLEETKFKVFSVKKSVRHVSDLTSVVTE